MPRKEEGFTCLEGFDHIDKDAEHMFVDLTRDQKREHQMEWRKKAGYNNRWSVETVFSTFKRVLDECVHARKWENVKTEIYGKVFVQSHD